MLSTRPRLRRWLLLVFLLFVIEAAWSLATPLFAGADEPTQIVKAAAVVRGELRGTPAPGNNPYTSVKVPEAFVNDALIPLCYILHPQVPASCMVKFPPRGTLPKKIVTGHTYVGRYPPLYYALVGWPTLWFDSAGGVLMMRLLSALASAAALALAFTVAMEDGDGEDSDAEKDRREARDTKSRDTKSGEARSNRFLLLGVALAATPAVLFEGAVVNPTGLEASGAVALWACLARHATGTGPPSRLLVRATVVAGSVTALMRGLSPLWVAIIAAICALYAGGARLRELAALRSVRIAAAAVAGTGVLATAWIAWAGSLDLLGASCGRNCPTHLHTASRILSMTGNYLHQLIGVFGWATTGSITTARDTSAPFPTFYLWEAILLLLILVVLRFSWARTAAPSPDSLARSPIQRRAPAPVRVPPRHGFAVVACIAATVLLPVVIQTAQANNIGIIWQGRYMLPIAAGVPILAAVCWERFRMPQRLAERLAGGILAATGVAGVAAFWWALRRYAVGVNGPIWFVGHASWSPPFPALLLTAILIAALTGLYWWVYQNA